MEDEPRSARAEFRARLAAFAEEHPELDTGETARLFGQSLPDEDRGLVNEFLTTEAHHFLAWELRAQFSRTRSGIFAAMDITSPDQPTTADMPDETRERLFDRITQWREFVPSENATKILVSLNRPKLRESAQFDADHVARYGWKMMLKNRLADGLPDDTTEVREHYTPDQLITIGKEISKEMNRGNFRLRVQPVRSLPRPASIPKQTDGGNPERPEADRGLAAS
jgi:hypothetical protein